MSGEMAVSLVLKLNDQGSGAAARAMQTVTRALKETGGVAKSASAAAITAFRVMANARETLGIRSERAIQVEIRQTQTAYQDLAQAGQLSARELGRAQEAMRGKVAELRRELEGVKQSAGGAGSALRGALSIAGGLAAGRAVLAGPIGQTMSYDRMLANSSNVAFAGQSLDARRAGMRAIDAFAINGVRAGGGTREAALGAYDSLVGSNVFNANEAGAELPKIIKAATAANADPALMAGIAIRARQSMGITDTGLALDQAARAGQLGGFELKDMGRWLPQQMALAGQLGMRGDEGFRRILASNQAGATVAGSKDEAGNNLVNLLTKINSQDTARDAQKLGINLSGTLAAARGKGVNALDAFVNLTEQIVGGDKNYLSLREKAKTSTGAEQRATYESMGDILKGSTIGKLIQDRQALMQLIAEMSNRGLVGNVVAETAAGKARGINADGLALIAETPSFKAEQLAAEKAISMQAALDKVNPLLGGMAEGIAKLMRDWPAFSAAVVGSATALTALAVAAGAAALGMSMTGGGKLGIGMLAGSVAAGLGRAGAVAGGALLGGTAFVTAVAGAGGYAAGSMINQGINATDKRLGTSIGDDIGRWTAFLMAGLGSKDAERTLNLHLEIDGEQVATVVNKRNARQAARH